MLSFDFDAFSIRWYQDIINNPQWIHSMKNSVIVGFFATILATSFGILASWGLSRPETPFRVPLMGMLISPMIIPLIISAAGMFFFYSKIGLAQTYPGLILAHTALGIPFVVITVTATLIGFDQNLIRASQSLGANTITTFRKVVMPLILPGVISGALFAFVTSFDEVVVVLFLAGFEQRTIPRQMWAGIREQISPTILAVATILITFSVILLATVELLRRRSERLRGVRPT
jgi:putative spermidine/putrescine transport system permease protein